MSKGKNLLRALAASYVEHGPTVGDLRFHLTFEDEAALFELTPEEVGGPLVSAIVSSGPRQPLATIYGVAIDYGQAERAAYQSDVKLEDIVVEEEP